MGCEKKCCVQYFNEKYIFNIIIRSSKFPNLATLVKTFDYGLVEHVMAHTHLSTFRPSAHTLILYRSHWISLWTVKWSNLNRVNVITIHIKQEPSNVSLRSLLKKNQSVSVMFNLNGEYVTLSALKPLTIQLRHILTKPKIITIWNIINLFN